MFPWIRSWLIARREAKLEHLTRLARETDELLAFGHLSDETRAQLQACREDLQQKVRALVIG
jgi:polysaccharide deacetylase 2 family uncharacterized protein YibQ